MDLLRDSSYALDPLLYKYLFSSYFIKNFFDTVTYFLYTLLSNFYLYHLKTSKICHQTTFRKRILI